MSNKTLEDDGIESDVTRVSLIVSQEQSGLRLDQVIATNSDIGLSRSRVKHLIQQGSVWVGETRTTDPSRKSTVGDLVVVDIPAPTAAEPIAEDIPLDVLHEDDAVIVVVKPAGMVVHPGAGVESATLVNALLHHCGDSLSGIGGVRRPGIVHRLDKDTSGVMVVAKTDHAHRHLAEQFADHGRTGVLDRRYRALVWGVPSPVHGQVNAAIARSSQNRLQMAVVRSGGREAITHFTCLKRFGDPQQPLASEIECRLETGRTHQIRVHMTHIGHPVIGDPVYGRGLRSKVNRLPAPARALIEALNRQALHAAVLQFAHPSSQETLRFEQPLPRDMASVRDALAEL